MAASDPIVSWSAFELERRLQRADTLDEKAAVWRDADRARRDPDFRARLAEIAQKGRFQSGGWGAAQLGLAGATMAPMLPVVGAALGPVGILGGLGLAGLGALNIKEGLQRRAEGLPGAKMQMGVGALDVGLPFAGRATRLLRGLKGAKPVTAEAAKVGAFIPSPAPAAPQAAPRSLIDNLLRRPVTPTPQPPKPSALTVPTSVQAQRYRAPRISEMGGERVPGMPTADWAGTPAAGAFLRRPVPLSVRTGPNIDRPLTRLGGLGGGRPPGLPESLPRLGRVQPRRPTPTTPTGAAPPPPAAGAATPPVGTIGATAPIPTAAAATGAAYTLPAALARAAPRYRNATLAFESDLDKALYIVRNKKTRSAADEKFMASLRKQFPGESDDAIRAKGDAVNARLKGLTPDDTGNIVVPHTAGAAARASTAAVPQPLPFIPPSTAAGAAGAPTMGIAGAVTRVGMGLGGGVESSWLRPSLDWWLERMSKTRDVTPETMPGLMMAQVLGRPESAKLLARGALGRPPASGKLYRPLKVKGIREMTASDKTMEGRREPGWRGAEEVLVTDTSHSANEFLATVTKAERAAVESELLKSKHMLFATRFGGAKPVKGSEHYTEYLLGLSGLVLKNRVKSATKILQEMGLLTPQMERRLAEVAEEGYQRAQHGFATTGHQTRDFTLPGRGPATSLTPLVGPRHSQEVDILARIQAGESIPTEAQIRPMGETMVNYINSLQPLLGALGMLFASVFTADQLLPQGGARAAGG